MVLQISVKDEKAKLFLDFLDELKNTMVDKYQIISNNDNFFDEEELLKRSNEIKNNQVKAISKEEVFDGLC